MVRRGGIEHYLQYVCKCGFMNSRMSSLSFTRHAGSVRRLYGCMKVVFITNTVSCISMLDSLGMHADAHNEVSTCEVISVE